MKRKPKVNISKLYLCIKEGIDFTTEQCKIKARNYRTVLRQWFEEHVLAG